MTTSFERWDFPVAGVIWKILPCDGRLIVGEERDPVAKTMSLFCVSLDDGKRVWKETAPGAGWWTGIETVHRGVLLLHEYPAPGMPDHKTILAIDARSGGRLWENRDLAFAFASGGTVCASRNLFDRRVFHEIDLRSGAVGRELPVEEVKALRDAADEGWGPGVGIPRPSAQVHDAVRAAFPGEAVLLPGETLMHHDTHIENLYEELPGGERGRTLREHIVAIDAPTGRMLHRDVVCDGLSYPAGTTFFRDEERILYVRERSTLRSFALPAGGGAA